MSNSGLSPSDVVQGQLDAYNARDIDTFMSFWADDAQYYEHPSTLLASNAGQIRERHIVRFREANLHGKLVQRMAVGNMVVDQEKVTRTYPEGPGQVDVIAIYEVLNGKITSAWFKIGERSLG
ncbi:nuclear transport factor 2 family protein [Undibacterium sp.]|uniref:nuclear transport factor 2 family protein n=1 Tax=Undibacterium sp. TaxID=1914977 RepID=UPI00374DC6C9